MIALFLPIVPLVDPAPPAVPKPRAIVSKPIPYGPKRKKQMARYAKRHYGEKTWRLTDPKVVVLHYTVSNTWQSPWNLFASNTPAPGPSGSRAESPGGCTHFLVDKDGTIIQLAPLTTMCRHAIGINHRSVGIEFVEMNSASNILARAKQRRAGLRLVRWLQSEFGNPEEGRDRPPHGQCIRVLPGAGPRVEERSHGLEPGTGEEVPQTALGAADSRRCYCTTAAGPVISVCSCMTPARSTSGLTSGWCESGT